jgi:hypothetical protein
METNQNPEPTNEPVAEVVHPTVKHAAKPAKTNGRSLPRPIVLLGTIVVVAILIGFIAWCLASQHSSKPAFNENLNINTTEYQAVFLTNGQVYFGKLADLNHKYVSISDIYYLQVQQSLQDGKTATNSNSQVSLAKLGSELHGPEDQMHISSDQILFWENLKSDSKVVQAINKYQNQ